MAQTHFLPLPNKDLISSFAFNYYGKRLAASSLDHHIYVLSSDPDTGKWPEELPSSHEQQPPSKSIPSSRKNNPPNIQSWTAHEGPVIKVVWSDPVHGEILASAGTDGTVRIWEEDTRKFDPSMSSPGEKQSAGPSATRPTKQPSSLSPGSWHQLTIFADSNGTVRDIGFSPSDTVFRLASIATDHHLRLYECLETSSHSTDNWSMVINLDLSILPLHVCNFSDHLNPISSVAGSSFQQHPSFTSVRGFDPTMSLNSQKSNPATNFNLMNPLSGLRSSATPTLSSLGPTAGLSASQVESSGGWALSWCPETYWGDILSVSCGSAGAIRIFKFSPHSQWENFAILSPLSHPKSSTNDAAGPSQAAQQPAAIAPIASLAWAPVCGRDYHLIAAGHRDGRARIWKLTPPGFSTAISSSNHTNWRVELDTELEDHVVKSTLPDSKTSSGGGVGKCDWNVTGTVLSTSGSDGKVRIWKMGYTSRWINTEEISCTGEEDSSNEHGLILG